MANFFTNTLRKLTESLNDNKGLIRKVGNKRYFVPPEILKAPTQAIWDTASIMNRDVNNVTDNFISPYIKNRYVDPVRNIPNASRQLFGKDNTLGERGRGALGLVGGVATLFPDPIGDVALPAFDIWKGYNRSALKGGTFKDRLKSAKEALTLENPAGLGDALSNNPIKQDVGNIAELPLLLMAGGLKNVDNAGTSAKSIMEASDAKSMTKMSDILEGSLKRLSDGSSDAFNIKDITKFGKSLSFDEAKTALRNQSEENIKALQNIYGTLSRSTLYKSFDKEKALKALPVYIDALGGSRVREIKNEVFGTKVMKPKLVKTFWSRLKEEAGILRHPTDIGTDKGLLQSVDEMLGKIKKEKVNTPSEALNVDEMLKSTPQKQANDIYSTARSIIDESPSRADMADRLKVEANPNYAGDVFEYTKNNLTEAFKEIQKRVTKYISKEDFVDIIEGKKIAKNPVVSEMVDVHKKLTKDLLDFTENTMIGDIGENYFPHAKLSPIRQVMDQIFPDVWIDQLNTLGGHFKQRTGMLRDYSKDYSKVMKDYVEQVVYEKYRGAFKPQKKGVQEVIEHVKKLENESMNYIDALSTDKPKGEIKWKTRSNFLGGPMRTYNNIADHIKKEAPDFTKKFNILRDNEFNQKAWLDDIGKMLDKPDDVFRYIGEKIYGIESGQLNNWVRSVKNGANEIGNERMISELLYQSKKVALQDFIEETGKYKYRYGTTKDIINDFIDGQLKKQSLEPALLDSMTNHLITNFYRSHLGFNFKTGILQALEVNRIPATYGPKAFVEGLQKSLFEAKRLTKDYGFEDMKPHYLIEDYNVRVKPKLGRELSDKVNSVLMKHIQVLENWKNTVYAGAAESEGKALGLTGKELVDHVRDSVYRYAHIADEFNTPAFLMSKDVIGKGVTKNGIITQGTLNRALFQYGQFAIKNTFSKVDAFQQKEIGKLFGLLLADVVNIYIVSTAFNVGRNQLQNVIGSFMPSGVGPMFDVPSQLIGAWQDNEEQKKLGYSTNYTKSVLRRIGLGSFIPAGTQFLKTEGALKMQIGGYKATSSDNVAYPKSDNAFANFMSLLFGPQVTPEARQYNRNDYLREGDSNIYKELYKDDPKKAYEFYYSQIADRKGESNKQKGIEDILKGNVTDANIYKQEDGSYVVPMPSGQHQTIEQMLAQDKMQNDKITEIRAIMNRTGSYNGVPKTEDYTQKLFEMNGVSQEDYNMWLAKDTISKLKGKQRAVGIMELINERGMSIIDLYKMDVLTKTAIDDLETYGYIQDADSMWQKIQMTDPYYAKEAMSKLNKKRVKDILKSRASTQKKLLNSNAQYTKKLLSMETDAMTPKSLHLKPQKLNYGAYATEMNRKLPDYSKLISDMPQIKA